jgi:serine/threonine-protein kinase
MPDPSPSAAAGSGPDAQLIGTTIAGRYKVESLLGTGGMGAVFLVQHTLMRKRFALKMLHAETSQVPDMVARFEREAMASAHVNHPNIAIATDFGRAESGAFFLVLEYLEGQRLRDALAAGPLPVPRALHIFRQVASALERSHELGIIHRDLKPENIMLVSQQGDPDFVKVLDFGLAEVGSARDVEKSAAEGWRGRLAEQHRWRRARFGGGYIGTPSAHWRQSAAAPARRGRRAVRSPGARTAGR